MNERSPLKEIIDPPPFAVGDVVRLKSGSPTLNVASVTLYEKTGWEITVQWITYHGNEPRIMTAPADCFYKVQGYPFRKQ